MKTIMNYFSAFLLLVVLSSCKQGDITLDQFVATAVPFEKQQVLVDSNSFSLMIPKGWTWKNDQEICDGKKFVLFITACMIGDAHTDLISIQKVKSQSNSNDLKTEYEHLLAVSKKHSHGLKLVESGKTDELSDPAYFFHNKSDTGTYGEMEAITFILKSEEQGFYYYLIAGASQTEKLMKNMSMMIHSLKTFKIGSKRNTSHHFS
jgi:hypothetical protein